MLQPHLCCVFPSLPPGVLWALHLDQEPVSITTQPFPADTVKFTCKVTGGSRFTYIHWFQMSPGPAPHSKRLVCITLSASDINWDTGFPKRNILSTHTHRHLHAAGARAGQPSQQVVPLPAWDCTHNRSLNLRPFTTAVVCLQRKEPHNAVNFLCRDIPAYLSMGEQQAQRPGSA